MGRLSSKPTADYVKGRLEPGGPFAVGGVLLQRVLNNQREEQAGNNCTDKREQQEFGQGAK